MIFAFFCLTITCQSKKTISSLRNLDDEGRVKIDYYGYSKCPDYVSLESEIVKIPSELDELYDLNLYFYANEDANSTTGFECKHGESECRGDFASECAIKLSNNNRTQWLNFTQCENADYSKVPENQDTCAESAGLDTDKFHACITDDGPGLLRVGTDKVATLGIDWSPTIYFNDVVQCKWNYYPCNTPDGAVDFARLICTLYAGTKELPLLCADYEGRVKIDYYGNSKSPDYVSLEEEIVKIPSELNGFYDLNLYFFATIDPNSVNGFTCDHGDDECLGNFASACAIKQAHGNHTQWLNFTQCENANYTEVPENQDACATSAGLNLSAFHECIADVGRALLQEGTDRAAARKVTWSPTIFFNDVAECLWGANPCTTPNGSADFTRLICTKYAGPKELPSLCAAFFPSDGNGGGGKKKKSYTWVYVLSIVASVLTLIVACWRCFRCAKKDDYSSF